MRSLLLLSLIALLAGCERPFIEPAPPTIELVGSTDLSIVRSETQLPLAFRATATVGAIDRVEVNGLPATFFRDGDLYLDTLQLSPGVNRIVVEAFTGMGTAGGDTLFAVYLPAQFDDVAVQLPAPLGGHAAVALSDGTTLLTGGAAAIAEPAQNGALRFDPRDFSFRALADGMAEARVGHVASRLPDGRVLITGGSRRLEPAEPDDFVTEVELFDPLTETFMTVPLVAADGGSAAPVRRTEHTVTVLDGGNGEVSVYLYGGVGNLGTLSEPVLGALPFMRRLRFEEGPNGPRLVVPNRSEGFRFAALAGHTQTPLPDVGADGFGRYLVVGASNPADPEVAAPFVLVFASSFLDALAVGTPAAPRTDAAAASLADDLVLVTGGVDPERATVLSSGEVFAVEAGKFFRFDDSVRLIAPRRGHTATKIGDDRILLVGGFSASGQALSRAELFVGTP